MGPPTVTAGRITAGALRHPLAAALRPARTDLTSTIRDKHGVAVPPDDEFAATLIADDRILLVFTPAKPQSDWMVVGLD